MPETFSVAAHTCRIVELHCGIAELSKTLCIIRKSIITEQQQEPEDSKFSYQNGRRT